MIFSAEGHIFNLYEVAQREAVEILFILDGAELW
jgi:hypothetical protein